MASNIDATQPPALNPTTAAMRANMAAAKSEIEALQSFISKGSIALWGADTWSGSVLNGTCDIPSATLTASPLGTKIAWSGFGSSLRAGVLFDTTPLNSGAFNPATPYGIVIPAGVTMANFSGSLTFPTPNGAGIKVVRIIKNDTTHMSNVSAAALPAASSFTHSLAIATGWINVTPGDIYSLHGCQDSGVTVSISVGTEANKGGSTYFRADFR